MYSHIIYHIFPLSVCELSSWFFSAFNHRRYGV